MTIINSDINVLTHICREAITTHVCKSKLQFDDDDDDDDDDDNDVSCILGQCAELYFDSTSSLKQQPISLCSRSLVLWAKQGSNKYQFYSLWFYPTRARSHDLPHSR